MTAEPEYTPPAPFPEAGFVVFGIPGVPYSSIHLPLVWDINQFNILVASAMESAKLVKEAYEETFADQFVTREAPQAQPVRREGLPQHGLGPRAAQPQQRRQQAQQGGGQQQTRAERFPLLDGWQCDQCGGPVGVRAKTGRMQDDAAVCLGNCKDGNYVHSLGWVNG